MMPVRVDVHQEVRRIEDVGFVDFGGGVAINELKDCEAGFGNSGERCGGFAGAGGVEEFEEGPLLPEAVAGVGIAPEVALEQEGVAAAIDTPDGVVASAGNRCNG